MNRNKFLRLLFDERQLTCFAEFPFDTAVKAEPGPRDVFFSLNALSGPRADGNVVCYRNFLLELDNIPLDKQVAYVTSKLPVSAITFSGNKSYHFIISLTEPVQSEAEYRKVWRGLYEAVPEADKTTKNPSRLSRLPQAFRPDTGLFQELLYLGSRIELDKLPKPTEVREYVPNVSKVFVSEQLLRVLEVGVDTYIETHFSGRNQFFYWLGKRCSELGHTRQKKKEVVDKFYELMHTKKGFGVREAYHAARVAW